MRPDFEYIDDNFEYIEEPEPINAGQEPARDIIAEDPKKEESDFKYLDSDTAIYDYLEGKGIEVQRPASKSDALLSTARDMYGVTSPAPLGEATAFVPETIEDYEGSSAAQNVLGAMNFGMTVSPFVIDKLFVLGSGLHTYLKHRGVMAIDPKVMNPELEGQPQVQLPSAGATDPFLAFDEPIDITKTFGSWIPGSEDHGGKVVVGGEPHERVLYHVVDKVMPTIDAAVLTHLVKDVGVPIGKVLIGPVRKNLDKQIYKQTLNEFNRLTRAAGTEEPSWWAISAPEVRTMQRRLSESLDEQAGIGDKLFTLATNKSTWVEVKNAANRALEKISKFPVGLSIKDISTELMTNPEMQKALSVRIADIVSGGTKRFPEVIRTITNEFAGQSDDFANFIRKHPEVWERTIQSLFTNVMSNTSEVRAIVRNIGDGFSTRTLYTQNDRTPILVQTLKDGEIIDISFTQEHTQRIVNELKTASIISEETGVPVTKPFGDDYISGGNRMYGGAGKPELAIDEVTGEFYEVRGERPGDVEDVIGPVRDRSDTGFIPEMQEYAKDKIPIGARPSDLSEEAAVDLTGEMEFTGPAEEGQRFLTKTDMIDARNELEPAAETRIKDIDDAYVPDSTRVFFGRDGKIKKVKYSKAKAEKKTGPLTPAEKEAKRTWAKLYKRERIDKGDIPDDIIIEIGESGKVTIYDEGWPYKKAKEPRYKETISRSERVELERVNSLKQMLKDIERRAALINTSKNISGKEERIANLRKKYAGVKKEIEVAEVDREELKKKIRERIKDVTKTTLGSNLGNINALLEDTELMAMMRTLVGYHFRDGIHTLNEMQRVIGKVAGDYAVPFVKEAWASIARENPDISSIMRSAYMLEEAERRAKLEVRSAWQANGGSFHSDPGRIAVSMGNKTDFNQFVGQQAYSTIKNINPFAADVIAPESILVTEEMVAEAERLRIAFDKAVQEAYTNIGSYPVDNIYPVVAANAGFGRAGYVSDIISGEILRASKGLGLNDTNGRVIVGLIEGTEKSGTAFEKELVNLIDNFYDRLAIIYKNDGILEDTIQNYITHMYRGKKLKKGRGKGKTADKYIWDQLRKEREFGLVDANPYRLQRRINNLAFAEEIGLEPIYHPGLITAQYFKSMQRQKAGMWLRDRLLTGYAYDPATGEIAPLMEHVETLKQRGYNLSDYRPASSYLEKGTVTPNFLKVKTGDKVKWQGEKSTKTGSIYGEDYMIHKDATRLMESLIEHPQVPKGKGVAGAVGKIWYKSKIAAKKIIMMHPMVHGVNAGFNFLETARLSDKMGSNVVALYQNGKRLSRDLDYLVDAAKAGLNIEGAMNVSSEFYDTYAQAYNNLFGDFTGSFRDIGKAHERLVHGMLWDQIRTAMIASFDYETKNYMKQFVMGADGIKRKMSKPEAMRLAAHEVNTRFGMLPEHHKSVLFKKLTGRLLFAKNWTPSNIEQFTNVMADFMPEKMLNNSLMYGIREIPPELRGKLGKRYLRFWLWGGALAYGLTDLWQYGTVGKHMWDNEEGRKWDILLPDRTSKGGLAYAKSPFGRSHTDILGALSDATNLTWTTALHKMDPFMRIGFEAVMNMDSYTGEIIADESLPLYERIFLMLDHAVKATIPSTIVAGVAGRDIRTDRKLTNQERMTGLLGSWYRSGVQLDTVAFEAMPELHRIEFLESLDEEEKKKFQEAMYVGVFTGDIGRKLLEASQGSRIDRARFKKKLGRYLSEYQYAEDMYDKTGKDVYHETMQKKFKDIIILYQTSMLHTDPGESLIRKGRFALGQQKFNEEQ